MTRTATIAKLMVPVVLTAALVAVFAAHSGAAKSMSKQLVVRTANNPTLHQQVLVNRKGLTLYSLSVEQRGRFDLHRGLPLFADFCSSSRRARPRPERFTWGLSRRPQSRSRSGFAACQSPTYSWPGTS